MNNILLYSDLHITQSSLKECILILEEIGMLANKHNCDTLINLGDTFNSLKPTSSELDVFATFIRRLNKKIIILAANSHESETEQQSILNHYGILSNNVTIVKEYKDGNHLYCGHFSIKESTCNYDAKLSKEDFKNYLYVFLGHIHSFQIIKPNIVHLGSSRYVSFDESKDKQKVVALISDYGTENEKVHFLKLKSPIPMIQLELCQNTLLGGSNDPENQKKSISEGESALNPRQNKALSDLLAKLDQLDPKTKVRIVYKDYESYREFLPYYQKYEDKFVLFKDKKDFIISNNLVVAKQENITLKESLINWLEKNKVDEKIKQILLEEING